MKGSKAVRQLRLISHPELKRLGGGGRGEWGREARTSKERKTVHREMGRDHVW